VREAGHTTLDEHRVGTKPCVYTHAAPGAGLVLWILVSWRWRRLIEQPELPAQVEEKDYAKLVAKRREEGGGFIVDDEGLGCVPSPTFEGGATARSREGQGSTCAAGWWPQSDAKKVGPCFATSYVGVLGLAGVCTPRLCSGC
jgi:hypothetical protein